MKKFFTLMVAVWTMSPSAFAQFSPLLREGPAQAFNHLDLAVTAGTTGIGIELATPIGEFVQVRAGVDYMPKFNYPMTFDIQLGNVAESKYDAEGNRVETRFDRMASKLKSLTGYEVDDEVEMIGEPTFRNFKLLFDVYPFRYNKHWHFTAGFYLGPSRIGKAYNTTEEMASLLAVGIYNKIYDHAYSVLHTKGMPEPLIEGTDFALDPITARQIESAGRMGIHVGNYAEDIYDEDGELLHAKGSPYMMEPGKDGMVKAEMKVNNFKPYLGFGYGGRLVKGNDRCNISFDCGAMFWGGTPSITTHDGTDLIKDVEDIGGKVGDYVDIARKVKVFPVLNLRLSYRLF